MYENIQQNREITSFMQKLRNSQTSALLLDYDGTLAPFQVDRSSAVPFPGVQEALQDIADLRRTRIIIVTGRSATEIHPLLQIRPAPEVWGSHGFQRLRPDSSPESPKVNPDVAQALANAERWLAYQGLYDHAEPKPGSIAVHWRGLDEATATAIRDKVFLGWSALTKNYPFTILEFDGGVELRLADYDKGSAIRTVLREISPQAPVAYLGDDRSDETAFRALGDRGLAVLVRKYQRHSLAQVWLQPPEELLYFLALWKKSIGENSTRDNNFSVRDDYKPSSTNDLRRRAAG
jgi:trehalose 6-phosphate phosphatase